MLRREVRSAISRRDLSINDAAQRAGIISRQRLADYLSGRGTLRLVELRRVLALVGVDMDAALIAALHSRKFFDGVSISDRPAVRLDLAGRYAHTDRPRATRLERAR